MLVLNILVFFNLYFVYLAARNYGHCIGTRPILCSQNSKPVCGRVIKPFCFPKLNCNLDFPNPCEACRDYRILYYKEGICV